MALIVKKSGDAQQTPAKQPLEVPTQALADAIGAELTGAKVFSPSKMPLTALAYTAIDRIAPQKDGVVEALLAYVDTDTICYRATGSKELADRQHEQWDPLVSWAGKKLGAIWQITTGIMPVDQAPAIHQATREYLSKLSAWQLSAACVLASIYSSLILAMAVLEKHLPAEAAFALARLEEDHQAKQWGRDEEADKRSGKLQAEILSAGHFLRLLEQP